MTTWFSQHESTPHVGGGFLTTVHEQKLSLVNVSLSEVHDRSSGSALQSQVTITGLSGEVMELLWSRIVILCTQIFRSDFGHRADPDLV